MIKLLLFIVSFFFLLSIDAQIVKGKITDTFGNEVPFAKIRVMNTTYGTSSNAIGNYQLELKKDQYILIFSAFGYATLTDTIQVTESVTEHSVILQESINQIDEIVIIPKTKKDKGKEIMRQVIDKRSQYQDLLSEYRCDTYCFSSLEKDRLDSLHEDSIIGREKMNLIEWKAITSYKKTARFKDEFYAYNDLSDPYKSYSTSNVTVAVGSNNEEIAPQGNPTENPYLFVTGLKDVHFSIFDNTIEAPKLTQNPIISPLAYNAFVYYNFYLEETIFDSTQTMIYQISVKPRFDHETLLEGTLFIKSDSYEVVSYDLGINPAVLLFIKDIRIICDYKKEGDRLIPVRKEFIYNIKEGKTNLYGLTRIIHKDYSFKVDDNSSKFWLETTVYKDDAFDKDSSYWNETRPFTLKDYEKQFIKEQDSIINYHESDAFLAHDDSIRNKISFQSVIFNGIGHVNSFKKYEFTFSPLIEQVVPFGVGGYRHKMDFTFQKEFKNGKVLNIAPGADYGFYNKDLKGFFGSSFMYNTMNFSKIGFEVGDVYDFISGSQNIQSTLAPSNRVRNRKAEINFSRELINGLYFKGSALYSFRESIDSIKYPDWVQAFGKFQTPQQFDAYRILFTTFNLEYHFYQKYSIRKNKKIIIGSPWPILYLKYKKGIPGFFHSEANFDMLEFELKDDINFNSFGTSQLQLTAGSYLRTKDIRLIEHKFFRPSDQFFFSNPLTSLQLLDTALNTSNNYLQLNYIHHFNGFFLNKIWGINKLKLEETVGGGFLTIPDAHFSQIEFFAGLERKIRIKKTLFKIGAYAVTQDNTFSKASVHFKFGINFYNVFTNKWDY